ncbi:NADPH dehydrogenase NamA [Chryseobacterium shigense]|uniref:NADPH2 dehydrogenase n=1 Tax=Chryseobacterium shigense TaxID=297244 RepID=A0A1N7I8G0_9FLAO|nr:NADPH dehydrogenase NamA [Chryseobacterium shigense]PQA96981.1 NADPH dehydrogenase NamA [Chryseobacterium shigense]SIS33323.1 NADPH2 dehydrogenase [Chryseobacterium shigense]
MNSLLFSPFKIKNVELKNRVVMSPMCMHSADDNGNITDWLKTHYSARALGQVGLIFLESLVISEDGKIGPNDIGVWSDSHIKGLSEMVDLIHGFGSKIAAQISHAGRLNYTPGIKPMAPSPISFSDAFAIPREMTKADIAEVIKSFGDAARRVKAAGFDILEIHTAHGYLLNEFLSPLANQRTDEYGGTVENRYRIVGEIIQEVKKIWDGPLFVRISSSDYKEGGNTPESFLAYGKLMKEDGVDLIDCSSGGIAPVKVESFPNYQVPAAELLRKELNIATGAVGLIQTGKQAEEILRNNRADLVFIGRQLLKDPFWVRTAADELGASMEIPVQYTRYGSRWINSMS